MERESPAFEFGGGCLILPPSCIQAQRNCPRRPGIGLKREVVSLELHLCHRYWKDIPGMKQLGLELLWRILSRVGSGIIRTDRHLV